MPFPVNRQEKSFWSFDRFVIWVFSFVLFDLLCFYVFLFFHTAVFCVGTATGVVVSAVGGLFQRLAVSAFSGTREFLLSSPVICVRQLELSAQQFPVFARQSVMSVQQ